MPRICVLSVAILVFASAGYRPQLIGKTDHEPPTDVFALFDLAAPESGPFPSDIFTVEDRTQNTGRLLCRNPSPVPSCKLTCVTATSAGSDAGSTAKPWVGDVISTLPVSSFLTGWLAPRCPNLSLKVVPPRVWP